MNRFYSYRVIVVPVLATIALLLTSIAAFATTSSLQSSTDTVNPNQPNNIFGTVWTDFNQNGQLDTNEPLAAGAMIFITPDIDSDFAQVLVIETDQQGQFRASNLTPGRYRVWAASQRATEALVINVTDDRAIMTIQLPLVGFTLYMPHISN